MADNEHPREQPVDPAAPPPAVRPPTEITPEQIRQFQDFQRFQELMRDQADKGFPPPDTPPPPGFLAPWGQPPKESLPKRLFKAAVGKIITGLVILAVVIIGGYLAIDYFLGPDLDKPKASEVGGKKAEGTLLFETSPDLAVRRIYEDIAQGDSTRTCDRFEPAARDQFTKNMAEYGHTCKDIVQTIYMAVAADRMKSEYANPRIPASAAPIDGATASVSSCAIEVTGGPRLGLFTLRQIPNSEQAGGGEGQWIVSAHQAEPVDCAGLTPPTTPSN
ncbi:hypothetical protein [Actinophytocola sp.]|uniref:hypothetical protein n=1 Tax=Actinophytocola sp. TaxID=1872138 RepID=UPI002ED511E2